MAILQNYQLSEKGAERKVAFSPDGICRDVVKVYRSGREDRISSYQEVFEGDIIVTSKEQYDMETGEASPLLHFAKVTKVTKMMIIMSEFTFNADILTSQWLTHVLTHRYTPLFDWITGFKDTTAIPAGFGWDGVYTDKEKLKLEKIVGILKDVDDDEIIKDVIGTAMVSPHVGLMLDWEVANPIPRDPLIMPPRDGNKGYLIVEWHEDGGSSVEYIDDEDSLSKTIDIDISAKVIKRALVGVLYKTAYGTNIRWKLYA